MQTHVLNTTVEKFEAALAVPRGVPESIRYQFELAGIGFVEDWGGSYKATPLPD